MRRFIVAISVLLLACRALAPLSPYRGSSIPVSLAREDSPPASSSSTSPGSPAALSPTPAYPAGWDLLSTSPQSPKSLFAVLFHPDGLLYVGDQVSMEVIAPPGVELEDSEVLVMVDDGSVTSIGSSGFGAFGIGGRFQATMLWVWDTKGLEPGNYILAFTVNPDDITWTESVVLHPEIDRPPPEPDAHWDAVEIKCCVMHYITDTPAARDLPSLLAIADTQSLSASAHLGVDFSEPIPITILPRVLGHGGFAGREIHVSYLDRNYAGSNFSQVLHHEMIHILDGRLGGDLRPTLFVEGLAVYLSRGHYKPEPLFARASALLDLGWYTPLAPLADNFYTSQHEIGYLEAGALVKYMVDVWGWQAFSSFYRDIHPHDSGDQSQAIDAALQAHFSLTLDQLEQRFLTRLHRQHINPDMYDDVRLSVDFYETVRRYQQLLDPSAFFLTAWIPDGEEMRARGLVADYLRHPSTPNNVAIESLLVVAEKNLRGGDYVRAERTLATVNAILDGFTHDDQNPYSGQSLGSDQIVFISYLLAPRPYSLTPMISAPW